MDSLASTINTYTEKGTVEFETTHFQENSDEHTQSFVDYVPPPEVKILPPAKYKLWLIIFALVYLASWVSQAAGLLDFLRFDGWLSPEASQFLMLAMIVFVMVFATLDLVIALLTITTKNGNVYGLGSWMKQPRASWMFCHDNLFLEIFARVIRILEDGFSMFDAPPHPKNRPKRPSHFDCENTHCHAILKIEHRIQPEKIDAYHRWSVRIKKAMLEAPGFISSDATYVRAIDPTDAEEEMEEGAVTDVSTDSNNPDSSFRVIFVKFENIDALNAWLTSPRRKALMRSLDNLLAEPDVVQVQKKRQLPDAFSDLLTRQGETVPPKPPKKWKVWWLTTLALFITSRWTSSVMPYYFDKWGLTDGDQRVKRLVSVAISTFLNSYVATPLFLFVFHHWLQRTTCDRMNTRQPWKMFDEGIQWIGWKLLMTVAFYGGCLAAVLVKKYQEA